MKFVGGLTKYLLWGTASLIFLIMIAGLVQYDRMLRVESNWDQTVTLDGLPAAAQIERDHYGVPHVSGATDDAVFYAMGFAHAQDRMWQMEFIRRTVQGRWAEVLGPPVVEIDGYIRTVGLYRAAERAVPHLHPETQNALKAYAAGVNGFLASHDGPVAPEFAMLMYKPEPWKPADSLAVNKLLAVGLGKDALQEPMNARLAAKLSGQQLAEFLNTAPGNTEGGPTITQPIDYQILMKAVANALPFKLPRGASNSWVMNSDWTATDGPLLANDPHLGLWAPSIFYLAHMQFPDGSNAVGATVAGMPFVVMGRTDHVAWGFTNGRGDVQDLFVETLIPGTPLQYETEDGPKPVEERTEIIRDRLGGKTEITIQSTRHGPLLPVKMMDLVGMKTDKRVALSWTTLGDQDSTIDTGYSIMKAKSAAHLRAGLRRFVGPQQNIVYADRQGHIGYMAPAQIPVRNTPPEGWGPAGPGRLPTDGSTGETNWVGVVPWDGLPQAVDPERGFIVTANNKSVPDDHPYFIASDWGAPYRASRITDMIKTGGGNYKREDLRLQQKDVTSDAARAIIPALLKQSGKATHADADMARKLLGAWDFRMDRHQIAPLIYAEWVRQLARPLFADELGPELFKEEGNKHRAWLYDRVFNADASTSIARWCDNVDTRATETCEDIASIALDATLVTLADRFGDDINAWRWGDAHVSFHQHQPLGYIPFIGAMFNRTIPSNGGPYTVDRGNTSLKDADAHRHLHGSAYRAVYDLAEPDKSGYMINTGQSGIPTSTYYDNLMVKWRDAELIPIPTDPETYRRTIIATVKLQPTEK